MYKKIYFFLAFVLAFSLGQGDSLEAFSHNDKYKYKRKNSFLKKKIKQKKMLKRKKIIKKYKKSLSRNLLSSSSLKKKRKMNMKHVTRKKRTRYISSPSVIHAVLSNAENNNAINNSTNNTRGHNTVNTGSTIIVVDTEGNSYNVINNSEGQTGWNCFDQSFPSEKIIGEGSGVNLLAIQNKDEKALALRKILVDKILNTGGEERKYLRTLLADEMYDSAFVATFCEGAGQGAGHYHFPQTTKTFVENFLKNRWIHSSFALKNEINKLSIDMSFFENPQANGLRDNELKQSIVEEFVNNDEIFESYVKDFYGQRSYFARPNSENGTGMMNIIAHLYKISFVIYGQNDDHRITVTNRIGDETTSPQKTYKILLRNEHFQELIKKV